MSHRLHAIHIHKQNADDRPGQHVTDEHLYTVGDHFAVVDKYTDDRFPAYIIEDDRSNSYYDTAHFCKPLHFLKAVFIFRPVIISQKRLNTVGKSHL